jgi:hypothetical protein
MSKITNDKSEKDLEESCVAYFRICLDEERITTRKCSQDSQPLAGEQKKEPEEH